MIVRLINTWATFITSFNENYNLEQSFTNIIGGPISRNGHIDFTSAILNRKATADESLPKRIDFSHSSDDAPPMHVNDAWIGGGHGQPCCINVLSHGHKKTLKDLGAIYRDDDGSNFTLVEVINEDYLKFVSDNIGESVVKYAFKLEIVGKLTYVSDGDDTSTINIEQQTPRTYLLSALKYRNRKVVTYTNGVSKTLYDSGCECDYAEMWESYDIMNPATVAPALTKERPEGGYKHQPPLCDFGEPMISLDQKFIIQPDGSIIVDFKVKKLMDVCIDWCMGVMYQEKLDVYGGGIHRYLSKLKPFTTPEGTFDFTEPYPLRGGAYPNEIRPNREYWKYPDSPFDRVVDYFRDTNGEDKLCFTCGFLPVHDGLPSLRKNIMDEIALIYKSRKFYPFFASGNYTDNFHGVAYKKFFEPNNRSSVYAIPYDGKKYIYFDLFKENTLTYKTEKSVFPFEVEEGVNYQIKDGVITVSGSKGFATFIEE